MITDQQHLIPLKVTSDINPTNTERVNRHRQWRVPLLSTQTYHHHIISKVNLQSTTAAEADILPAGVDKQRMKSST